MLKWPVILCHLEFGSFKMTHDTMIYVIWVIWNHLDHLGYLGYLGSSEITTFCLFVMIKDHFYWTSELFFNFWTKLIFFCTNLIKFSTMCKEHIFVSFFFLTSLDNPKSSKKAIFWSCIRKYTLPIAQNGICWVYSMIYWKLRSILVL